VKGKRTVDCISYLHRYLIQVWNTTLTVRWVSSWIVIWAFNKESLYLHCFICFGERYVLIPSNWFPISSLYRWTSNTSLLFADDTVLFSYTKPGLQTLLNKLHTYCNEWGITVNTDKTVCMVFKKCNTVEQYDMFYNNNRLTVEHKFTYLGVTLSSNGLFYQAQITLATQSLKSFFSLSVWYCCFRNNRQNKHFWLISCTYLKSFLWSMGFSQC